MIDPPPLIDTAPESDPRGDGRPPVPDPVEIPFGPHPDGPEQAVQVWLGTYPFVLIEAVKRDPDPDRPGDDGLRLAVKSGGADNGALALLYLVSLSAEQNPLTAAVRAVLNEHPEHVVREVLEGFAEYIGFPMPEARS